ncbi:MAG: phycobiliprotein lyase [Cyanobacteriota bacterium]|nr:phycobiliprotein lyase [Cyanobacteriota bacterium]
MSDPAPFPPADLAGFLQLCAGEWLALRSLLTLDRDPPASPDNDDEASWHESERGELRVEHRPAADDHLGGLTLTPSAGPTRALSFYGNGRFAGDGGEGRWQLWPDGSLELVAQVNGLERRERIWFTKPNLRLRSSVEHHADGRPGRASFSTEIRRVSRP